MATLVTGGAGYIGSHTVVALHASGREVVIFDDFSGSSRCAVDAIRSLTHPRLPVVEGDTADSGLLRAAFDRHHVDSVIHFAALKSVPESAVQPLRYYRVNVASTIGVAEAAAERGNVTVVFSSSAAVYGSAACVPVAESADLAPESPYGHTKAIGEQILSDTAAATDVKVVLLRYFNPAGAHPSGRIGEDPAGVPGNLVPRVMQTAIGKLGAVPVFGTRYDTPDGTAIRDYVHVVDVAEGHVAALATAGSRGCSVYNLGTGRGYSVLEVLSETERVVGRRIPRVVAPPRAGDAPQLWADCGKARAELGWYATCGLPEMLRDHWRWQRQNPDGYSH